MGDHYGRQEIEADRRRFPSCDPASRRTVAPQQSGGYDADACIAAMTELRMLYRRGWSETHDFPRIRAAVDAYRRNSR